METRRLGRTGLEVTRLGFGLAEIERQERYGYGDASGSNRVLEEALDGGITFLDTAACYANTEELIGKTVAHRRDEYILATKCGHVVEGTTGEPWNAATIEESIDRSLRRMKTDHLDIVQPHSPDLDTLERGEIVEALVRAKMAGKTRFLGFSGDNEAARWAVNSGVFDTLQTTFNLVDQRARDGLFVEAQARDIGIIVKRPLANGMWGKDRAAYAYAEQYLTRVREMARAGPVPGAPDDPILLSMGFVFAHPEVDMALVGTNNLAHLRSNIKMVEMGLYIRAEAVDELHRRFDEVGSDWPQLL
jgi:hypothetical protein